MADNKGTKRRPLVLTPAERQAVRLARLMQQTAEAGRDLLAAIDADGDLAGIAPDVRGVLYNLETGFSFVVAEIPGWLSTMDGN